MRLSLLALAISLSVSTACSPTKTQVPESTPVGLVTSPQTEGQGERDAISDATTEKKDEALDAPLINTEGYISKSNTESGSKQSASRQEIGAGRARLPSAPVGMEPTASVPAKSIAFATASQAYNPPANTEHYAEHVDNPIQRVAESPVSTFSIDVDTGSYSNVRRMLMAGQRPPADAVRAEEMINYFDYGYPAPTSRAVPFRVSTEIAPAPWNSKHQLLQIGIQGYSVPKAQIPASNLVFLIDTSGSMESDDKLPLLKQSFRELARQLRPQDRVSIVVYAGSAGLVLPPTAGNEQGKILAALDRLQAGGSTNGGEGLQLAYATAKQSFLKNGVNRVILATDGDFNVGVSNQKALETMIGDQRASGIALTTLGFGTGNYNDSMAEQLADLGNGNHAYIDSINEGRKVLVEELSSTMLTIAQDVKIQLEFNPAVVAEYRLIGYENRALRREDFNNDKVDAGEIGAGHDVTALYEITLVGSGGASVDPLRYAASAVTAGAKSNELGWLRLRYKQPGAQISQLIQNALSLKQIQAQASPRLRWAAAVAAYADLLRGGKNIGNFGWEQVRRLAKSTGGDDRWGYHAEFLQLLDRGQNITAGQAPAAISE